MCSSHANFTIQPWVLWVEGREGETREGWRQGKGEGLTGKGKISVWGKGEKLGKLRKSSAFVAAWTVVLRMVGRFADASELISIWFMSLQHDLGT